VTFETSPANLPPVARPGAIWRESWTDAFMAIAQMPAVALTVFVILILIHAVSDWAFTEPGSRQFLLIAFGITIGKSLLVAPLLIAVHRYVLLGEVTPHYTFWPIARYLRFVGYAVVFEFLLELPLFDFPEFEPSKVSTLVIDQSLAIKLTIELIVSFALTFIALCMLILFPAIAVDARDTSWHAAIRQSMRYIWRLLFTVIAVTLSLAIGVLQLGLLLWAVFPNASTMLPPLASSMSTGAITVFSCALYAAMASRLYWSVQRSG
jgi:hypothetical protein